MTGIFYRVLPLLALLAASGCTLDLSGWADEVRYVERQMSEPLQEGDDSLQAQVELKVGTLEVAPGESDQIYAAEFHYNELAMEPVVRFSREEGQAELEVRLEGQQGSFRNLGENRMAIRLNPDLPLDLSASTGVGESRIQLGGMTLRSVAVENGVGHTEMTMLQVNRGECRKVEINGGVGGFELTGLGNFGFEELRFRGGVGGATLDFSGAWESVGEVIIEVGVGGVELVLPRSIGAEVEVSKGLFSGLEMPGFTKQGDTYLSENIDRVEKVVQFQIRAGIGGVEIRWI